MIEISPFLVYLITRLDRINDIITTALAILLLILMVMGLVITIYSIFLIDDTDDVKKRLIKLAPFLKPMSIITTILLIVHILLPTTKQACTIIVVPAIANSQIVQQTLPKSIDQIVKLADEYLTDILSTQTDKTESLSIETETL